MSGSSAIGPGAILSKRGGRIPIVTPLRLTTLGPLQIWRDLIGSSFLYTAANWGAVTWYLEVYVRATSAKALARLYDITSSAEVANSSVVIDAGSIGVLLVPTRARSLVLTLVDGHEYRVQYGVQDGGSGAAVSAKLIAV